MKNLRELTQEELKAIQGGDWIKETGRISHRAWCKIKEVARDIVDTLAKTPYDGASGYSGSKL